MKHIRRRQATIPRRKGDAATEQNSATPDGKVCHWRIHSHSARWVVLLALHFLLPCTSDAQVASTDLNQVQTTYIFAGIGGFIPMTDSYRLNYSTRLAELPLEISGGILFPISHDLLVPVTVRYVRREANFIASTTIGVLSLEPGVRFYLEKEVKGEVRIFGGAEGLILQASVASMYDANSNGTVTGSANVSKDYLNFGIGFDLGVAYPLTENSALDGTVHTGIYLANPVSHGGLGNIGGVSLTVSYRFGF